MCVYGHHMWPLCVCYRVLISSDGMSPWHPSMIHIKSQLALKFGQTPKVCVGETYMSANGRAGVVILAEIESDHRSQWARVSQRVTITLMTSSLLTARTPPMPYTLLLVASVCLQAVTHQDL